MWGDGRGVVVHVSQWLCGIETSVNFVQHMLQGNPGSLTHYAGGCKPCNKYNPERCRAWPVLSMDQTCLGIVVQA